MSRTIIRAWNKDGYHKDIVILDDQQVRMSYPGMEPKGRHIIPPLNGVRVVLDPKMFGSDDEIEIIVEPDR